ncbi:MAG TPA: tetratricopeptide repeat protein [Armatimonadetes bacterium]|nr:tetratricopeptide repeat protein [Armatimonadota bacterium]
MWRGGLVLGLLLPSLHTFSLEAFNRITVFNAVQDAAEARKSCGVDPVKISRAIDAFRVILDLYPDAGYCAYSWNEIGELYLLLKDWPHAIEAFRKVLMDFPRSDYSDDALNRVLQYCRQTEDWRGAVWAIERFVSSRPSHPMCDDLLMELSRIYERLGDLTRAIEALQRLATSYPDSEVAPRALYRLAWLYQRAGNFKGAIEAYDRIVNFYPFSDLADDAALASAGCLRKAGDLCSALARLQAFVQFFPGSEKVAQARREMMGLLRQGYRVPRQPVRVWIKPIFFGVPKRSLQGSGTAKELFERARRLRAEKALSQAISLYARVAQGFPGSDLRDNAQFSIGECYEELSLLAKQASLATTPERQAEVMDLFRRAVGKGKLEGLSSAEYLKAAIKAYRALVENFPGSELRDDALARIVHCYKELGEKRKELEAGLELISRFPWSRYVRQVVHKVEKVLEERGWPLRLASVLVRVFEPLAKLGPGCDLYDEAVYLAACGRMGMGDLKGARKLLRRLIRTWDDSPYLAYAQFLLARSYEVEGDLKKAAYEYAILLEDYPKSGLADDAQRGLRGDLPNLMSLMDCPAFVEAIGRTREYGADIIQRGQVVLVCPFLDSPLLRAYNFPEVLAQGWEEIRRVTGVDSTEPVVVALTAGASSHSDGPILLPFEVAVEPPKFEEAFSSMAERAASDESLLLLSKAIPSFPEAFGQFAGVLLRFNLVHETRDVIGGAQAAVVPFDSVREVHDTAYQALAKFIASGDWGLLTPEAVCGLLFGLVEAAGAYKENVIGWGPLPKIFALARSVPREVYEGDGEKALAAFAWCIKGAMGGKGATLLAKFGFKVDPELVRRIEAEIAARP